MYVKEETIAKYLEITNSPETRLEADAIKQLGEPAYPGLSMFKIYKALQDRIEVLEYVIAAIGSTNPEMNQRARIAAEHTRARQNS